MGPADGATSLTALHVGELGEGPAVVFLHPGPGVDGSVFLPGAERLASTHRVLLVDLPGNGRSPDGDRGEWTYAGFARAVEGLAGELGLTGWTLLRMIEGAGHFPFAEAPDAYWDGLAAWLARTEAA